MKNGFLKTFLLCLFSIAGMMTYASDNIVFSDSKVKELCVGKWDTNNDGELSAEEAAAVTSLELLFMKNMEITSFDELQYFTGLTTLEEEEFSGCENLASVVIPNTITTIEGNAFYDCYALTEIVLPSSVKKLADAVFVGCTGLTTITIPAQVEEIGFGGFIGCSKLKSIEVDAANQYYQSVDGVLYTKDTGSWHRVELVAYPDDKEGTSYAVIDGTTAIQAYSFMYSKITELTLPESLYNGIGEFAFGFNTALRTIKSYISNCSGGFIPDAFSETVYQEATLYVLAGKKESYQATFPWDKFAHIEEMIEINAVNFPDENFRNWLLAQDYGADGVLTETEIREIDSIDADGQNIANMKGIEHFTSLTYLACNYNQLTTLDVSSLTALEYLECGGNQLTTLDVSKNMGLIFLFCAENLLKSLDLSNNPALTYLYCYDNQLTSLNVSKNTALTYLWCYLNQLSSLDVSNNVALMSLSCNTNQLTSIDVSRNTALTELYCSVNQLTALDVSKNKGLTILYCGKNQLSTLDVSANTELTILQCFSNQLTTLDVSNNTALTELWCNHNQLTALDLSNNPALTLLDCYNNSIKGTSMDALIQSLPENTSAEYYPIHIIGDPGVDNVCTKSQVAAAKAKGWMPQYYPGPDWAEYEGSEDETDGIVSVGVDKQGKNVIYTINGVKCSTANVSDLPAGIYIVNGKKYVVK